MGVEEDCSREHLHILFLYPLLVGMVGLRFTTLWLFLRFIREMLNMVLIFFELLKSCNLSKKFSLG